jgi:hypothetical protein
MTYREQLTEYRRAERGQRKLYRIYAYLRAWQNLGDESEALQQAIDLIVDLYSGLGQHDNPDRTDVRCRENWCR